MISQEWETRRKKEKAISSCFLNTGFHTFILLWILPLTEPVLTGWVAFPLGHPLPYQETKPLTLCFPSLAHGHIRKVYSEGLGTWPFFLKRGFSPTHRALTIDKSISPLGIVPRCYALDLNPQSKSHPCPQAYIRTSLYIWNSSKLWNGKMSASRRAEA